MKIGIMSDTHISKKVSKLDGIMESCFGDIDLLIHAGDYKDIEVVEYLKKSKDFIGVYGNVDCNSIKSLLNEREIISIEGYRIGIYHGHGKKGTTIERSYNQFIDDNVDIIIFGHSHQPIVKTMKKTLMLNPGSLINKRRERWFSYIILNIKRNNFNVEINFFDDL
ncbi:metallophosphoesterase family protein [Thermohalobacter berrensis]|uniref:Phosphoesterase n=1 Tax=Thermohalobacter berrensis TaxID=99594 RepID=A0A419SV32_9FIRM|nr:metallophosphoesterase family protein [Thermohalobacter berrensis]RKD29076.1 YfcE family phosphodiesterase [Thermohalobacter berrensis]